MNRINFAARTPTADQVKDHDLLEMLEPPPASSFGFSPESRGFHRTFRRSFDTVVQPIVEGELGYRMVVVDGSKSSSTLYGSEIFAKLHRSRVVLADITACAQLLLDWATLLAQPADNADGQGRKRSSVRHCYLWPDALEDYGDVGRA